MRQLESTCFQYTLSQEEIACFPSQEGWSFLQLIWEESEDHFPQEVFADWLEEQADEQFVIFRNFETVLQTMRKVSSDSRMSPQHQNRQLLCWIREVGKGLEFQPIRTQVFLKALHFDAWYVHEDDPIHGKTRIQLLSVRHNLRVRVATERRTRRERIWAPNKAVFTHITEGS